MAGEEALRAGRRDDAEAELGQPLRRLHDARLVGVAHRNEGGAGASAACVPPAIWLLAKASGKAASMPITSPVDLISGPSTRVDVREAGEGEHRLLHRDMVELPLGQIETRRAALRP